jgi:hypothetical protein
MRIDARTGIDYIGLVDARSVCVMACARWLRMHAGLRMDGNSSLICRAGLQKRMNPDD